MKKLLTLLFVLFISTTMFSQEDASLVVKPSGIQLGLIVDIDTISLPELGDIILNKDTLLYQYNGIEWLPFAYNVNNNTECCPNIVHHVFLGEPNQAIFLLAFGHSNNDYMGTLYEPNQNKAWYFTYIHNAPEDNWKWIALKD